MKRQGQFYRHDIYIQKSGLRLFLWQNDLNANQILLLSLILLRTTYNDEKDSHLSGVTKPNKYIMNNHSRGRMTSVAVAWYNISDDSEI